MNAQTSSLYDALGGQATVNAVVEDFYGRILGDETINHYFAHVDMARQERHQAAFVTQLLGGPRQYQGRSLAKAHAHLNLTEADFDAVAGHLVASLEGFSVPQEHIDTIVSAVVDLKDAILGRRLS